MKDGATFTTFDVPGATATLAFGINNAGQIVGRFNDVLIIDAPYCLTLRQTRITEGVFPPGDSGL